MAYSDRNEAPAVEGAMAGLGGDELEDAAGLGADRASRNARLSQISCPCQTTRTRPVRNNLNVDRSDLWTEEFAFPSKPGHSDIQNELFCDYQLSWTPTQRGMDVATSSLAC